MEIRPAAREFESLPEFVALSPEEKIQFIESVSADMDENDKKFFIDRGNRALEESTRADGTGRLFRQDKVGSVIKDVLPSDFNNLGKDQQLEAIEKAREVVEDKALEVDPVNRNDTAYFADTQLGRLVREVQKDDVGEVGDKFNRFAGGLIQSVFAPFSEQGTREFLEMNFPTNPDYDTTAASKFTQAAGDFVGQIGQFFAISAFATPVTAIGAGFAQNASRKFQENYDLAKGEMGLGDDEALAAGIAGVPGAVIDSLGDALLLKGIKLGSLGKSFKSMTAAEKAAEIVKKGGSVLRDPSMMRSITAQAAKGALLEGTSETLGDAATGWGGYATSGHEGFKPSAESLWDSFWIGGVLGGLAGGALNSRAANRDTKALRQLGQMNQEEFLKLGSETQQQIADFMDSGEYSKALELVGQFKQETAPSAPQGDQATAAPSDAQTPADQAAPKLDDDGQPIPRTDAELAAARALVEDAVAGNLDNIKFANENPETKARFETIRNAVPAVMKTLRALLSPEAEFKMTLDGVNEAINQARTPSAEPAAQQPQTPEAKPKRKTKAERMAEIRSRLESAIDELINKSDAPTPDQEGDTKDNEIMDSLGNFPSEDLPAMVDDIQTINQEYQQTAKADGEALKDSLLRRVDRMESLARYKGVVLGKAASVNAAKVIATGLRNKINQAPDDAALGEVNSEIDQLAQDGKVVNQDEVTQMVDKLKSTGGFADTEAQLNVQEQQPSGMLFQGAQGTPAAEINPLLTGLTPEQLDALESVVNALRELGIDETVKEADRELAMEIRKAVAVGEMSDELNDKLNANAPSRAIFHNKLMKLKGFGDTTKRNVMMQQDVIALNYLRTGKSMQAYWAKVPDVIVIDEKGYEGAQGAFIPDNAFSPSEAVEDAAGIMRPRTISVTDETADDRSAPLAAPIPNTIVLVRGYYNASTILHENDHNLIATGMVQEILDATDPALYDELLTELGLARGQQWTIGAHEKYARAREAWIRGGEVKSIFKKVFDALKGIFTNLYADGVLDKFRNPVLEKAFAEIYDIQDLPKKKLTDKVARDYGYEASKLVGHVPIRKLAKAQNFMETAKLEPSYDAAKLLLTKLATTMDSGTPAFTEPEHQAMQDVLRMVMVGEAPVMAEPVIPTSSYVGQNLVQGEFLFQRSGVTQQDADYLAAVERGDMEAAQRMVDEAARAAGYTVKAYHGSPVKGLTSFDPERIKTQEAGVGFFFASNREQAENYAKGINGQLYEVYLKQSNPLKTSVSYPSTPVNNSEVFNATLDGMTKVAKMSAFEASAFKDSITKMMGGGLPNILSDVGYLNVPLGSYVNSDEYSALNSFSKAAIKSIYDTLRGNYGRTASLDLIYLLTGRDGLEFTKSGIFTVLRPNQIKSADPVTRDANGNVIPLSQRFNPASDSILFQRRGVTQQDVSRFNELTSDLYAGKDSATQEEIDAWKQANPEKWDELSAMRERALKAGGWDKEVWHYTKSKDFFDVFNFSKANHIGHHFGTREQAERVMSRRKSWQEVGRLGKFYISSEGSLIVKDGGDSVFRSIGGYKGWGFTIADSIRLSGNDALANQIEKITKKHRSNPESFDEDAAASKEIRDTLIQNGYKTLAYQNLSEGDGYSYIPLNPNQIKSAEPISAGRKVTPDQWADSGSDSILFQMAGERELMNPLANHPDLGMSIGGGIDDGSLAYQVLNHSQRMQRGYPEIYATINSSLPENLKEVAKYAQGIRNSIYEHIGDLAHRAGSQYIGGMRPKLRAHYEKFADGRRGLQKEIEEENESNAAYQIAARIEDAGGKYDFNAALKSPEFDGELEKAKAYNKALDASFAAMYSRLQSFTPAQAAGRNMAIAFGMQRYNLYNNLGAKLTEFFDVAQEKGIDDRSLYKAGFDVNGVNNLSRTNNELKAQWETNQRLLGRSLENPENVPSYLMGQLVDQISHEGLSQPIQMLDSLIQGMKSGEITNESLQQSSPVLFQKAGTQALSDSQVRSSVGMGLAMIDLMAKIGDGEAGLKDLNKVRKDVHIVIDSYNKEAGKSVDQKAVQKAARRLINKFQAYYESFPPEYGERKFLVDTAVAKSFAIEDFGVERDSLNRANNIRNQQGLTDSEERKVEMQRLANELRNTFRNARSTNSFINAFTKHVSPIFRESATRIAKLMTRGVDNIMGAFNEDNFDLLERFVDNIKAYKGKEFAQTPEFIKEFQKTIGEVEEAIGDYLTRQFYAYNSVYMELHGIDDEIDSMIADMARKEGEGAIEHYNRIVKAVQAIEARMFNLENELAGTEEGQAISEKRKKTIRTKREKIGKIHQQSLLEKHPTFESYLSYRREKDGAPLYKMFEDTLRMAYDTVINADVEQLSDADIRLHNSIALTLMVGGNNTNIMVPMKRAWQAEKVESWKALVNSMRDRVGDNPLIRPIYRSAARNTTLKKLFNTLDKGIQAKVENFHVWVDRLSQYAPVRAWFDQQFFAMFQQGTFVEAENTKKAEVEWWQQRIKEYNDDTDNTADANPYLWVMTTLGQYNISDDPNKTFKKYITKARTSIARMKQKNGSTMMVNLADRNLAALNYMLEGIDLESDTAYDQFMRLAETRIGANNEAVAQKRTELLRDVVDHFQLDIANQIFVREVIHGKEFTSVVNYMPLQTMNADGSPEQFDWTDLEPAQDRLPSSKNVNANANESRKLSLGQGRAYGMDFFNMIERKLVKNAIDKHSQLPVAILADMFKTELKVIDGAEYRVPKNDAIKEIFGTEVEVAGELDTIKEKITHQLIQVYGLTEPPSAFVSAIKKGLATVQAGMLSGVGQVAQQATAATVDYMAREEGNLTYMFDAIVYWSKNYQKVRDWMMKYNRDLYDRGNTQGIMEFERHINNAGSELGSLLDKTGRGIDEMRKFITLSLRYGDKLGAEWIFLAEHMKAVRNDGKLPAGAEYDIDDFTNVKYTTTANSGMARYIGTSSAAGRSYWMSDHKQAYFLLRSLTGAFQSSAHNMSSQILSAARNYVALQDDKSEQGRQERRAELRRIGSIMAQQATFTGVRHIVGAMMTYALVGALRSAYDDEEGAIAEAELNLQRVKKTGYPTQEAKDRALAEAERKLADLKTIRRAVTTMKQQASTDGLFKSMVRDQLQNLHIIGSVGDGFALKPILMVPNMMAEQSHKEAQDLVIKGLTRQRSEAIAMGDRVKAAQLAESISDARALEFIPFFYEKKDKSGFGGIIGGALDPIYSGLKEGFEDVTRADRDFLTTRAFVPDLITYMSALGVGQADANRIAKQLQRLDDQLSKNREEVNERAAEKAEKLTNKSPKTFILKELGDESKPAKSNKKVEIGQMIGGYRVASADELGLVDFFKKRKDVAGMAWGGGANGTDPKSERVLVYNPYNEYMKDESRRQGLLVLEAARHEMDKNPVSDYPISEELQKWRELTFEKGNPYREDDKAFRETVVSRALVGDTGTNKEMKMPIGDVPVKEIMKYQHLLK